MLVNLNQYIVAIIFQVIAMSVMCWGIRILCDVMFHLLSNVCMNHNDVKENPMGNPHTQYASSLYQHFLSYISEHFQELIRKRTEQETTWQIDTIG